MQRRCMTTFPATAVQLHGHVSRAPVPQPPGPTSSFSHPFAHGRRMQVQLKEAAHSKSFSAPSQSFSTTTTAPPAGKETRCKHCFITFATPGYKNVQCK